MLSLLIREDRHFIRREYLLRFVVALILILIISTASFFVVLFSFNMRLDSELKIVSNNLEEVRNSSNTQNINELINLNSDIENKISQFNILDFNQSDLLEAILLRNQEGISLNLINIQLDYREEGIFANIEIKGISENRNILLSYQEGLSESEIFESVSIPFSSFAQNSNIPFVFNIETVELNNYFENEN